MSVSESYAKFKQFYDSGFDYESALVEYGLVQKDVDRLREKIKSKDCVPKAVLDRQLMFFLVACDNDLEKASILTQNHSKLVKETSEFFKDRDTNTENVRETIKNVYNFPLPTTPDNCNLIFFKLANPDPKSFEFDDLQKYLMMVTEYHVMQNGPKNGVVTLIDMKGMSIGHVFKTSLSSIRKCFNILQTGCPFKVRGIHVLNTATFVNIMLAIIKPFIKAEYLSQIHFHRADMDYEKFYKDCIPKSCLPNDYGGDLESVGVLNNQHSEAFLKTSEFFLLSERLMNHEFDECCGADMDLNAQF